MSKSLSSLLIVALLITMQVLAACGGAKETTTTPLTTTTPPATTSTPPPTTSTPPPTTTTPGETLGEILGRSAGITSVKYDMLVTSPETETLTTKMWIKDNKMRTETTVEGETAVILIDIDAQTMYMYMPAQNMAMKMTFEQPESAIEEAQSIPDYNPTIVGTETMDGKVCLVVKYNEPTAFQIHDNPITVKMWIWKDKGFPIRAEMVTGEGKTVIEYKNIEFADIPDSIFKLPEGVEIQEIPGM